MRYCITDFNLKGLGSQSKHSSQSYEEVADGNIKLTTDRG